MASLIISKPSSTLSPCEEHPESSGHSTQYPPSSRSGWSMTLNPLFETLIIPALVGSISSDPRRLFASQLGDFLRELVGLSFQFTGFLFQHLRPLCDKVIQHSRLPFAQARQLKIRAFSELVQGLDDSRIRPIRGSSGRRPDSGFHRTAINETFQNASVAILNNDGLSCYHTNKGCEI
jgi:hypothetical protein